MLINKMLTEYDRQGMLNRKIVLATQRKRDGTKGKKTMSGIRRKRFRSNSLLSISEPTSSVALRAAQKSLIV